MSENRNFERVDYKIKSEVHGESHMTYSTSGNLSEGGIFINTPEPLAKGTELDLVLHTKLDENFTIKGIVCWTIEEETACTKTGMGIQFTDLDVHQQNMLKKMIAD